MLKFRPPEDVEACLQVINATSIYIDLYLGRKDDWTLLNLLTKAVDDTLWKIVSKCVVTESGLSIEDVEFKELGTKGVLEALGVFCRGIEELELPDVMGDFCSGLSTNALASMLRDIESIRKEAGSIEDPSHVLSTLISKALARSL